MKKILFLMAVIAVFMFVSCGNDVTNTGSDKDQTNDESVTDNEVTDEAADEATDEISDEITDETADETTDEMTDEMTDDDTPQECTNLNVTYSSTGLEPVATDISLAVYSNGWGGLLDTLTMDTEGELKIEVPEENP